MNAAGEKYRVATPIFDHAELLTAYQVPSAAGIYFLGPFNTRITFYSQQVRALRLAHALHAENVIQEGDQVAIVGAGAAGSTLAAALAMLGQQVTLFDPAEKILQLQSASSRLLHPHIYEWPRLGSLDDRAGLPIMDWSTGTGGAVCTALRSEFSMIKVALQNLAYAPGHKLTDLVVQGNSWRLTLAQAGTTETRVFQHVILSMGFGDERSTGDVVPEDYWRPGAVGTPATEPVVGKTYLVSGNGDGALTETLGLLIDGFEHLKFTRTFLGLFAGDELRVAAHSVYESAVTEQDIEADLSAILSPVLQQHGVIARLRPMLRKDRVVTINADGPLFVAGKASQLNQLMAFALLEAARVEGVTVARTIGFVSGATTDADGTTLNGISAAGIPQTGAYNHVILRHGPDVKKRYAPAAPLLANYKAHIGPLLKANPALAVPPVLEEATYELFEGLRIEKLADHASRAHQLVVADEARRIVEVLIDPAAHVVVERGTQPLAEIGAACERLPSRVTVDIHVLPNRLPNAQHLVRLAKCSGTKIELRAHATVQAEWKKLLQGIGTAPAPSSVRPTRDYDDAKTASFVDASLIRVLDTRVQDAVGAGSSAPIGQLSTELLAELSETWAAWRSLLDGDENVRFDFLRWLAQVDQREIRPWDGDHASIQRMANALIMIMAANCQVSLTPMSVESGNFCFEAGAVGLGTGCEVIGVEPISIRTDPDDWGVDALILSASSEVDVRNPDGRILDGGTMGQEMRVARRVSPAIIQNSIFWRSRLAGSLAAWKDAVAEEFAAWRQRQDDELNGVAE